LTWKLSAPLNIYYFVITTNFRVEMVGEI